MSVHLYMPDGGEAGVIQAWLGHWRSYEWVEFRGRPYSEWPSYGWSPFRCIHDLLPGWHSCVLHTDSVLDLIKRHPHYEAVKYAVESLILQEQ